MNISERLSKERMKKLNELSEKWDEMSEKRYEIKTERTLVYKFKDLLQETYEFFKPYFKKGKFDGFSGDDYDKLVKETSLFLEVLSQNEMPKDSFLIIVKIHRTIFEWVKPLIMIKEPGRLICTQYRQRK